MSEAQPAREEFRALAIVPVYNHAATLRAVAEGLLAVGLPVLVVDDGSTEDVLAQVEGLPVQTLRLTANRGKGAAMLAGAVHARAKGYHAILTIDADGQHHPSDAPELLETARRNWPAIVIGRRDLEGAHVPGSSRFGRAFSNFWVRVECGLALEDTQSGYRVYPVAFLEPDRFLCRRYTFEVEVLVRAAWHGLALVEVPIGVTYLPGRERISHFRAFRDNLRLTLLHTFLVLRSVLPDGRTTATDVALQAREALFHPIAFLKRLAHEYATPLELAAAVWLGIFLGSLPIIPFGLVVILFVSHRLRLNKLASLGASNLCVAPFVPFLCIQAGHFLRHGVFWTTFTWKSLVDELGSRLLDWLLGSLLVGPLLGILVALPTFVLLRQIRRGKTTQAPSVGA